MDHRSATSAADRINVYVLFVELFFRSYRQKLYTCHRQRSGTTPLEFRYTLAIKTLQLGWCSDFDQTACLAVPLRHHRMLIIT